MAVRIGVWIDHRKAVMVRLVNGSERVDTIESNMEQHIRPSGGARSKLPYGPQDVMKEDGRERKFRLHLSRWYDTVAGFLRGADEVLLFGPGEGKNEFCRHIESTLLSKRVIRVETVDKMTDRQIAAKVRDFFIEKQPLAR